ncbi:MAG: uracil-DNA glycosylase family protein [Chloroflexi bacterium]|nr:uracil-DNA glycosylase family protein [Chloroflexota bacterium]
MVNESRLAALNARLDECSACATISRGYRHVPGGGCSFQPQLMLVFINPTVRNMTAHTSWPGPRFPFAGKPKLWEILATAGFVRSDLPQRLAELGRAPEMVEMLIDETRRQGLYVTNAVKCVDDGSNLPAAERVAAGWPLLAEEIALVQPRYIVAFGLIPFRALTGCNIRLADQLWEAQQGRCEFFPSHTIDGQSYPVFPCYFPTGRGNPVAATNMLIALHHYLASEPARATTV